MSQNEIDKFYREFPAVNAWILSPILRCTEYIADQNILGGITKRSITSLSMLPSLLNFITRTKEYKKSLTIQPSIKKLKKTVEDNHSFAETEIIENFTKTNSHTLVSIWNAVETALDDTFLALLINAPDSYQITLNTLSKNVDHNDFISKDFDKMKDYLYRLTNKTRSGNNIIENHKNLFGLFGITLSIDDTLKNKLIEAKEIRNCIVHRGYLVDQQAVIKAPTLQPLLHQRLTIDDSLYLKCFDAVSAYVVAITGVLIHSQYMVYVATPTHQP